MASFIGLDVGLTIFNVNTSANLFRSSIGNQNIDITFSPGIVIRTIIEITGPTSCSGQVRNILTLVLIIMALAVLVFTISLFFFKGKILKVNGKMLILIFIGIILAIVFIETIANSNAAFCP